jgi:CheY-like chemotaxis protein
MNESTVLLVDDEEEFVEVLAERLETRGLTVDTAGDGELALEKRPWARRWRR